jgi:hypothetical protein
MGSDGTEDLKMRIRIRWDIRLGKKRIKGSIEVRF